MALSAATTSARSRCGVASGRASDAEPSHHGADDDDDAMRKLAFVVVAAAVMSARTVTQPLDAAGTAKVCDQSCAPAEERETGTESRAVASPTQHQAQDIGLARFEGDGRTERLARVEAAQPPALLDTARYVARGAAHRVADVSID